jgi:hypothetical protein
MTIQKKRNKCATEPLENQAGGFVMYIDLAIEQRFLFGFV